MIGHSGSGAFAVLSARGRSLPFRCTPTTGVPVRPTYVLLRHEEFRKAVDHDNPDAAADPLEEGTVVAVGDVPDLLLSGRPSGWT